MQMYATQQKKLTKKQVADSILQTRKDQMLMVDYLKATSDLLTHSQYKKLSYRDKVDLFFVDYNLIPLLVQDSYLTAMEHGFSKSSADVSRMAQAAEFMSLGDVVGQQIMGAQNWTLLPEMALTHVIGPAHFTQGECSRPSPFPTFFGKLSKQKKSARLI